MTTDSFRRAHRDYLTPPSPRGRTGTVYADFEGHTVFGYCKDGEAQDATILLFANPVNADTLPESWCEAVYAAIEKAALEAS